VGELKDKAVNAPFSPGRQPHRPWRPKTPATLVRDSNMGGTQSTPKITAQDRAILEYAFYCTPLVADRSFLSSLKIQRDKLKQYQKRVGAALRCRLREGRNTWQLICLPLFSIDPGYFGA
jgi:hypothetical protein